MMRAGHQVSSCGQKSSTGCSRSCPAHLRSSRHSSRRSMPLPAVSSALSAAAAAEPGRGKPSAGLERLYVSLVARAWPALTCARRARFGCLARRLDDCSCGVRIAGARAYRPDRHGHHGTKASQHAQPSMHARGWQLGEQGKPGAERGARRLVGVPRRRAARRRRLRARRGRGWLPAAADGDKSRPRRRPLLARTLPHSRPWVRARWPPEQLSGTAIGLTAGLRVSPWPAAAAMSAQAPCVHAPAKRPGAR